MNNIPIRSLFWTILIFLLVVLGFVTFLWPLKGLIILGILLILLAIVFIMKRDWWELVWFHRKKKEEAPAVRATKETIMVLEDCETGEIHEIGKNGYNIGRKSDCDLVISDASVSRNHCRITYRPETNHYYIEDLGSTYGTFVGVHRLPKDTKTLLKSGDMVAVNSNKFIFRNEIKKK